MKKRLTILLFLGCHVVLISQKNYAIRTIGFYNVENLFDTINDPDTYDENSPLMLLKGNLSKVYWNRITHISKVISKIGYDKANNAPSILGIAEVENKNVLKDLVASEHLKAYDYHILHFDSPDQRGIDVALIYQQSQFSPTHYEAINPRIYHNNKKVRTRDILWVSGYLDTELIHVIVNHWPSRRGGEEESQPLRKKAAYSVSKLIERIKEIDAQAKIIVMGDFNDDPNDDSLKTLLKGINNQNNIIKDAFYNPFTSMFQKGFNTTGYRDNINLFDQLILSSSFIITKKKKQYDAYKLFQSGIYNPSFLVQPYGPQKGYPFRSFSGGRYLEGYSDHYPVYLFLIKEVK